MFPSAGLDLLRLALLRPGGILRSIGHTLKSLILRFLLLWPHVLRSLRRIWALCSRTSPKDVPKEKGGQARPSSPRASGVCEGYSAIHASRDPSRAGEPYVSRVTTGPGNPEVLHLRPIVGQSQSASHTPGSSLTPLLPRSPQGLDRQPSVSSTPSIASPHISVSAMHPPGHFRSPSPSPSPSFQQGHLSGLSQFPTTSAEHSTPDPLSPGSLGSPYLAHGNARHSSGSLPAGTLIPCSDQARSQLSFPPPSPSRVSFVNIPVADASGILSNGKTPSIRLMHSEQVSRYVNKGDV